MEQCSLTSLEKEGVARILSLMPPEEVIALASTVTSRMVPLQNLQEAIKVICMFSDKASHLLCRQKVRKKYIYNYLIQNGVAADGQDSKRSLVKMVLKLWNSSNQHDEWYADFDGNEDVGQSAPELMPACNGNEQIRHQDLLNDMAHQFTSWFYNILNSLHPSFTQTENREKFDETHFWQDCYLNITCQDGNGACHKSRYVSQREVCRFLGNLVVGENLLFQPNLTAEGVKVCSDPHGLVKVDVFGVLHRHGCCVGLFEQTFGLIQDALGNKNWKIKFTDVRLQVSSQLPASSSQPKISF